MLNGWAVFCVDVRQFDKAGSFEGSAFFNQSTTLKESLAVVQAVAGGRR